MKIRESVLDFSLKMETKQRERKRWIGGHTLMILRGRLLLAIFVVEVDCKRRYSSKVFLERERVFLFYSVLLTDSLTKHEIK
jgi:hypothetical protein